MLDQFPRTAAAIEDGQQRKLHTGVQIYVSLEAKPVLNAALGTADGQRPLDADSILLWRSAGKPLTAALVLLFEQRGLVNLDAPLRRWISDAENCAVGSVTLRDLLAHRSGLPIIETGWPDAAWSDIISRILSISELSTSAAYQPQSSWFLLAEVLQRVADRSFSELLRSELMPPLQLNDTWCGIPEDVQQQRADRLVPLYDRRKGQLVASPLNSTSALRQPSPGGNFRGPVSELGRFYEWLAGGPSRKDSTGTGPEICRAMTTPTRTGQFDETLQHTVDFGLGVILNSNQYGPDTVPYGFGRHSSARTFGHGGAQCAMGFCDPEFQLVVAWAANGLCGEGWHQRRNRAINEAIYEDLGLC